MSPEIRLDGPTLRANAAAFASLGAPVAAVVKRDGYGWGARALARELDDVVESYVVADDVELAALRPATGRPIRLLADAPPGMLARILDLGGIPNVSTAGAVAEARVEAARRGPFAVRVGIVDSSLWAAIRAPDAGAFAASLAGAGLAVELWTHVTSPARAGTILREFAAARRAFEDAGVPVASVDAASTASAAAPIAFDRLRIGAGLFGARMGCGVAVRCAIRVHAPVVRRLVPGSTSWAGYGDVPLPPHLSAVVLRCGYGDGFPKALAGTADILSVGMQYTARATSDGNDPQVLVGADDDVDTLAARAGISPHEFVIGFACT